VIHAYCLAPGTAVSRWNGSHSDSLGKPCQTLDKRLENVKKQGFQAGKTLPTSTCRLDNEVSLIIPPIALAFFYFFFLTIFLKP
jgi:hypothetical protein